MTHMVRKSALWATRILLKRKSKESSLSTLRVKSDQQLPVQHLRSRLSLKNFSSRLESTRRREVVRMSRNQSKVWHLGSHNVLKLPVCPREQANKIKHLFTAWHSSANMQKKMSKLLAISPAICLSSCQVHERLCSNK